MTTPDVTSSVPINVTVTQAVENAKSSAAEISDVMMNKVPETSSSEGSSEPRTEAVSMGELVASAQSLEKIVNSITDTALTFSVEDDISKMVVAVRAIGSDKVIRQFPPEEFITVAKHIAAANPDMIDEDYLKGILFDQYT